ncbi:amidohydrolase [Actinomadura madurae]|nr:amidohydrolase [Actinomadura madurae]
MESADPSHRPAALGFASVNDATHHSCGHDAHTAIGLAVAKEIAGRRERSGGEIRLIFQPAEEGLRGGPAMVKAGVVEGADYFLGCHIGVQARRTGEIIAGYRNILGSIKFDARFTGRSAHAGISPHEGRNAIQAAAVAVQNLLAVSRHGDGETRVNIGRIAGGETRNAVPASALLCGEIRADSMEILRFLHEETRRVLEGAAGICGVDLSIDYVGGADAASSDPDLADIVARVAEGEPEVTTVRTSAEFKGSDDASSFMNAVQARGGKAVYFGLGSDLAGVHHSPGFDIDEASLATGVRMFLGCLRRAGGTAVSTDLVIRGGRAVLAGRGVAEVDLGVTDGRIVELADPGRLTAHETVDARGLLVLPGAIDMHVHFRQPGFEHKEDFAHGTAAAACGGVTTVCDMPNTDPPVVDVDRFITKRNLVQDQAHVDFALWAGGTDLDQLPRMEAAGAIGLKVYMNRSYRADDPYSDQLAIRDLDALRDVLVSSTRLGWPVSVHACDHATEAGVRAGLRARSRTDARLVCRAYRGEGALGGLRQVITLLRETGAAGHIAHVSLAPIEALDLIGAARGEGVRITCECGPPALHEDELEHLGVHGVPFAFPPAEAETYWAAIADGRVDCVATDHAPHSRADKEAGRDDVWRAPPGYPGVETSLP